MNILVTSLGNLLGQNILDALESRRDRIKLIGADNSAQNPRVFRSDILYWVPPTDEEQDFFKRLTEIIRLEKPDLILAGRDHDAVILSKYKEHYKEFSRIIPCGSSVAARLMQDKYLSYTFSVRNNLPFADTLEVQNDIEKAVRFCERYGFPIIAKQKFGYGSLGVYFLNDIEECREVLSEGEFIIQEYLDPDDRIMEYIKAYKKATPLFFQIPEDRQYAAQVIIGPSGEFSEVFTSVNKLVLGRCEYSEHIDDRELEELAKSCAEKFYKMGWYGFLNIQCKPDKNNMWKIHEFNPRMSGSTSARCKMGFDEIGIICSMFRPELKFPNLTTGIKPEGAVVKTLTDDIYVPISLSKEFLINKVWKKS